MENDKYLTPESDGITTESKESPYLAEWHIHNQSPSRMRKLTLWERFKQWIGVAPKGHRSINLIEIWDSNLEFKAEIDELKKWHTHRFKEDGTIE
jgi:hypothetical protein